MNKKLISMICTILAVLAFVAIIVIIGMCLSKKENFTPNNIEKALKIANYLGKRGIDMDVPKVNLLTATVPNHMPLLANQCPKGICQNLGMGIDLRITDLASHDSFLIKKKIFKYYQLHFIFIQQLG